MKQQNKKNQRGFTLAELIMAIALLSVFGVIVARMFFLSGQIADKTKQLDRAVVLAANITEQWQALPEGLINNSEKDSDRLKEFDFDQSFFGNDTANLQLRDFVDHRQSGMSWETYLDKNLKPCLENEAVYRISLLLEKTDKAGVWSLQTIIEEPENINHLFYSLQGERYFAEETAP